MKAEHFVILAGKLAAATTDDAEPRYRTAVSRAYYGAFLFALDMLDQVGKTIPANGTAHELTVRELRSSNVPEAVAASRLIQDLRTHRIKADYRMDDKRFQNRANAMLSVEDATNALSELQKCLQEPAKSKLVEFFGGAT